MPNETKVFWIVVVVEWLEWNYYCDGICIRFWRRQFLIFSLSQTLWAPNHIKYVFILAVL